MATTKQTLRDQMTDILARQREDLLPNHWYADQLLQLFQEWALEISEDDGFCFGCKRVAVVCEDDPCQLRDRILESTRSSDVPGEVEK